MGKLSRAAHCKLADEVLKDLLESHFFGKQLEWSWREGVSLQEEDPQTYAKILQLYPDMIKAK